MDHPEANRSRMVPVLDLQVWVRSPGPNMDGLDTDLLAWTFYEKSSASSKVMRATSAFNWRQKIVSLSMEVFRRLRNCTRQLTLRARLAILETFISKLRCSGYQEGTVRGILQSGLQYYFRKLSIDLQGGPKLNNRDDSKEMTTRRKKMSAKQNWFARRRGGEVEKLRKEQGWRSSLGRARVVNEPGVMDQRLAGSSKGDKKTGNEEG